MRPPCLLLTTMLAAAVLAGCGEEVVTYPDQSSYQTTSNTTASSIYTGNQGVYVDPAAGLATSSPTVPPAPSGSGVQAEVTGSQPRGVFTKTLELTVQVTNRDAVQHAGFLVATFKDAAGKTELQYLSLTLAANSTKAVTLSSTKPATSGSVVFKERFL